MRKLTLLLGTIILILDGLFWYKAIDLVKPADVYPKSLIILIAVFTIMMMVKSIFFDEKAKTEFPFKDTNFLRVFVSIFAVLLYILGMNFIGFYVSSLVFIVGLILVLGQLDEEHTALNRQKVLTACLISVVTVALVYVAFNVFLSVPTPEGLLI